MAVIDIAGFVADLKDHAVEHGFHVHDERHFVESYSLRQNWEVDLHPEEGCEGPVDLYLSLEIDPRVLLGFEDAVIDARRRSRTRPTTSTSRSTSRGRCRRSRTGPTCSCSPPSSPASAAPTSRSRCRPSTRSRRRPTPRSARCGSSPTSRCRSSTSATATRCSCEMLDRCLDVSRYLLEQAADWLG